MASTQKRKYQATGRPVGRPPGPKGSKLMTDEVRIKFMSALQHGAHQTVAAEYAGINESTLRYWLKQGSCAEGGPYREFFAEVTKVKAEAELRKVKAFSEAAEEDWKAAEAFLRSRYPQRWKPQDKVDIRAMVATVQVSDETRALPLDEIQARADAMKVIVQAEQRKAISSGGNGGGNGRGNKSESSRVSGTDATNGDGD